MRLLFVVDSFGAEAVGYLVSEVDCVQDGGALLVHVQFLIVVQGLEVEELVGLIPIPFLEYQIIIPQIEFAIVPYTDARGHGRKTVNVPVAVGGEVGAVVIVGHGS